MLIFSLFLVLFFCPCGFKVLSRVTSFLFSDLAGSPSTPLPAPQDEASDVALQRVQP